MVNRGTIYFGKKIWRLYTRFEVNISTHEDYVIMGETSCGLKIEVSNTRGLNSLLVKTIIILWFHGKISF